MGEKTSERPDTSKEFLTAKEVGEYLGMGAAAARQYILSFVPFIRIGRNEFRVQRSDLIAAIEKQKVQPPPPGQMRKRDLSTVRRRRRR